MWYVTSVVTRGLFLRFFWSYFLLLWAFRHVSEGGAFSNKAVYEGRNVFVCLPTGYGESKHCRLLWNTNLVEIELSSLCLPWSLHWVPVLQCQKTTLVQRSAFAETTCSSVHQKLLQLLNGEMSWKDNSFLLGLWPYQWMKHTVSQNGEFIARYC